MVHMKESDLIAAGIGIAPDGSTYRIDDSKPSDTWSLEQLSAFYKKAESQCVIFGKGEALLRYYQGESIHLARQRCQEQGQKWTKVAVQLFGNRMTPNRVERLFLAANEMWGQEAVQKVAQHTITELYVTFGIMAPKSSTKKSRSSERKKTGTSKKHDEHLGKEAPGANTSEPDENGKVPNTTQVELAELADKEQKAYQLAIRVETPKVKAVMIRNALQRLGSSLTKDDIDDHLRTTFGEIADLATNLQGMAA